MKTTNFKPNLNFYHRIPLITNNNSLLKWFITSPSSWLSQSPCCCTISNLSPGSSLCSLPSNICFVLLLSEVVKRPPAHLETSNENFTSNLFLVGSVYRCLTSSFSTLNGQWLVDGATVSTPLYTDINTEGCQNGKPVPMFFTPWHGVAPIRYYPLLDKA